MKIHTNLSALAHPTTWAGLAALAGSTATQLPEPHRTHLTFAALGCGAMATLLKQPPSDETKALVAAAQQDAPQEVPKVTTGSTPDAKPPSK